MNRRFCKVVFVVGLLLLTTTVTVIGTRWAHGEQLKDPQPNPGTTQPKGSGSSEELADQALRINDRQTGATIVIYESVLNAERQTPEEFSKLRAMIAPLGVIRNDLPLPSPVKIQGQTDTRYSLRLICFHDQMEEQAMHALTNKYSGKSQGKFLADRTNISRMTHQMVEFKLPDFPRAIINPIGSLDTDLSFNALETITVNLPAQDAAVFEAAYKDGTLQLEIRIHYRSKDVKRASFSWTADDIRKTKAYKSATSGGGAFVDATQVKEIVREVVSTSNAVIIRDPGVPDQLYAEAQRAFKEMMKTQGDLKVQLMERNQAADLEKKLLAGSGLSLEKFQPITVMWDVCEQLNAITDHKQANESLKKYFNEKTNKDKISTEVSASYGPFSAKVGYEKEMTQKNVEEGYFKDDTEYKEFRQKCTTEKGLRPIITPRGLDLIERQQFESSIGLAVSAVAYYPTDQSKVILIRSAGLQKDGVSKVLPNGLFERVPIGVVTPFAGEVPPEGWLACDGQVYDLTKRSELQPLANKIGSPFFDKEKKTLRLPDMRGRVVVGTGTGVGRTVRTMWEAGGDETRTVDRKNLPKVSLNIPRTGPTTQIGGDGNTKIYGLATEKQGYNGRCVVHGEEACKLGTDEMGEGKPLDIMPPYTVLTYIIKY